MICILCKVGHHAQCITRDFRGQCCCQQRACGMCGGKTEMSNGVCRSCQNETGGSG